MSYLSYPDTLPIPLQEGYDAQYSPAILRTVFADGSARQRVLPFNNADFSVNATLLLTGAQFTVFWQFYQNINYGADWFYLNMPDDTNNQLVPKLVRIQKGEFKKSLQFRNDNDFVYKVSFTLDMQ